MIILVKREKERKRRKSSKREDGCKLQISADSLLCFFLKFSFMEKRGLRKVRISFTVHSLSFGYVTRSGLRHHSRKDPIIRRRRNRSERSSTFLPPFPSSPSLPDSCAFFASPLLFPRSLLSKLVLARPIIIGCMMAATRSKSSFTSAQITSTSHRTNFVINI